MRHHSPWTPHLAEGAQSPAERLAEALGGDILSGSLKVDDRLPAHRDLAWRLGIGVGSVTRAYAILERRGLVRSVHGRGTFVAARPDQASDQIDLATNMPPPMFSDRALARTLNRLARTIDPRLFNIYPPVAGHLEHRRIMARWLAALGTEAEPERLLLTSGAQQALNVALTVARPHVGYAVTEAQTYPGMLGVMRQAGLEIESVAMDAQGMLPASLEAVLTRRRHQRAVVYLTPTMQNPTSATMETARRQDIARLCRRADALVIEDGVYVRERDPARPSLLDLAPERTFHVSSLSKILSPGLRIGVLIPPPRHAGACLPALLASSLMIAPLSYAMMAQWMQDGTAESVRTSLHAEAIRRQDLAVSILGEWMAAPTYHAFHAWLPMPAAQAEEMVGRARMLGVSLPGPHTFSSGDAAARTAGGGTGVRLALGSVTFRTLPEALRRVRQACDLSQAKVSRDTIAIS
ncbi:transcriptional regulator, GntR family with aminotransferase domain [Gluconacetobacter diazotrophicus PA1 5]|uniref:PLP-dependent aminotransferase family protein n=2 Tax=Gluconacetobacter diazotrophicus TaxID=33996 RepID=A0A7W4FCE7_GLUDI|nr:PLP-dependent aminotransferase family protein [Gluconacetobacter diazotrophicus]ACI51180.1 transcriptional regulator, GntR family with aminotransferase domain [Gluconacetobacter diazotrophicus PA1 5]MBB2155107.1 PLP-dependent aminotransferase family protein [Gluconacetobacter diazotrophicus]CAP54543.1 putative transcriptional regulator, GntR family [Gluconacetobacter diazotrophicus PA1 5]